MLIGKCTLSSTLLTLAMHELFMRLQNGKMCTIHTFRRYMTVRHYILAGDRPLQDLVQGVVVPVVGLEQEPLGLRRVVAVVGQQDRPREPGTQTANDEVKAG